MFWDVVNQEMSGTAGLGSRGGEGLGGGLGGFRWQCHDCVDVDGDRGHVMGHAFKSMRSAVGSAGVLTGGGVTHWGGGARMFQTGSGSWWRGHAVGGVGPDGPGKEWELAEGSHSQGTEHGAVGFRAPSCIAHCIPAPTRPL